MYTGKHVIDRNHDATTGRRLTISSSTSSGRRRISGRLSTQGAAWYSKSSVRRAQRRRRNKRLQATTLRTVGAQLYGRGREVHAWQTLRGAVARLSSVRPESGRRPMRRPFFLPAARAFCGSSASLFWQQREPFFWQQREPLFCQEREPFRRAKRHGLPD